MRRHLENLGYYTNEKGMCFGIALMGMQAVLADDLPDFSSRINILYETDANTLAAEIETAEQERIKYIHAIKMNLQKEFETKELSKRTDEKSKFDDQLSESQKIIFYDKLNAKVSAEEKIQSQRKRDLLSIKAFFDGLSLYFHPWLFPEIFENKLRSNIQNQYIESCFTRALPTALIHKEERKGLNKEGKSISYIKEIPNIEKVATFNGLYDTNDLIHYFTMLQTTFEKNHISEPVSMLLLSSNHTTTVGWIPGKGWYIIDPNNLKASSELIKEGKQVAELLMKSGQAFVTFSTEIYAKKNPKKPLKPLLDECFAQPEWQKIHEITSENKKALKASQNASWLYIAAREGDNATVKKLLEQKASVDYACVDDGATPLYIAAQTNRLDTVKILIEHKANMDKSLKNGLTPLCIAASYGYLSIVENLIEQRAQVELEVQGNIPLFSAAENGCLEVCKKLVESKADIEHKRQNDGATPFFVAAEYGQLEIAKFLHEKKVDINKPLINGATPLFVAVSNGHVDFSIFLINQPGINLNSTVNCLVPLLLTAQDKAVKERLQSLFQSKGIIGNVTIGLTVLHAAVFLGHTEIMLALLKAGMDVNSVTQGNISVYELAKAKQHTVIMEILLPYKEFSKWKMSDYSREAINKLNQLKNQPNKFKQCFENFSKFDKFTSALNATLDNHESKDNSIKTVQIKILREHIKLAYKEFSTAKTNDQELAAIQILADAVEHLTYSYNTEKDRAFFQKSQPFFQDLSVLLLNLNPSKHKSISEVKLKF